MITPILRMHNIDVDAFLRVLEGCQGNVYLMTGEGDKLNLKSRLCQLIGLSRLIEGGRISEAFIVCDNKSDESKLFRLNLLGNAEKSA